MEIHNTGYEVICAGFIAAFLAQLIKFITFILIHKKINFKCLTTTGGMPSSHSAAVCAIATMVGLITGFNSVEFAISFGFALVVMYDAAGVRRAAGKIAATLNKVTEEFYKHNTQAAGEKLKELLGHTPIEVFVGALLGIAVAYGTHIYLLNYI